MQRLDGSVDQPPVLKFIVHAALEKPPFGFGCGMDEGCHDRVASAFFPSEFAGRRGEGDQLFNVFRVGDHGEAA